MKQNALVAICLVIGLVVGGAIGYVVAPVKEVILEKEPVILGVYTPLTGSADVCGIKLHRGIEMAVDEINARGGVLGGRPLRIIVEDTESSPEAGMDAIHKLIDVDRVSIVLGPNCSSVALPTAPYSQTQGIPHVLINPSSTAIRELGDHVWSMHATDMFMATAVVDYAMEDFGGELGKVGIMVMDDAFGRSCLDCVKSMVTERGFEVVSEVCYEIGKSDYRADLDSLYRFSPDTIFSCAWEAEGRVIYKQANELGYYQTTKGHWYVLYMSDSIVGFMGSIPETIDELKGVDFTQGGPRVDEFERNYGALHPDEVIITKDPPIGYDALYIAVAAINIANSLDPENINAAMPLAFATYVGVSNPDLAVDGDGMQLSQMFAMRVFRDDEIKTLGVRTVRMD